MTDQENRDTYYEAYRQPGQNLRSAQEAGLAAVVAAAKAEAATGTITIPAPHVTSGPEGIAANVADAAYLRSAVRNIDHLSHGERLWGSGLTATVRKLLLDSAQALGPKATPMARA